jgi:hypothetical protein
MRTRCQGDCSGDRRNCAGRLSCYRRDEQQGTGNDLTPGCSGAGTTNIDYCYYDAPSEISKFTMHLRPVAPLTFSPNNLTDVARCEDSDNDPCAAAGTTTTAFTARCITRVFANDSTALNGVWCVDEKIKDGPTTWYVRSTTDQVKNNNYADDDYHKGNERKTPLATIQHALNRAKDGDTVRLLAGNFTGGSMCDVPLNKFGTAVNADGYYGATKRRCNYNVDMSVVDGVTLQGDGVYGECFFEEGKQRSSDAMCVGPVNGGKGVQTLDCDFNTDPLLADTSAAGMSTPNRPLYLNANIPAGSPFVVEWDMKITGHSVTSRHRASIFYIKSCDIEIDPNGPVGTNGRTF